VHKLAATASRIAVSIGPHFTSAETGRACS
jgi:hypothetical protein